MFHEFDDNAVFSQLEESGYGNLEPAISPLELQKLCEGDEILEQLRLSVIKYVHRYAHDVYSMMIEQIELSEKREKGEDTQEDAEAIHETDERRHNLHNALIDSINALSRELVKKEKDAEWMRELQQGGRPAYAKFALLTFYKLHVTMK